MNYAVIDLGSNTMRLSIYEYEGGQIHRIFNKKEIAGLAEYIKYGVLDTTGIMKACDVLNSFKAAAMTYVEIDNLHLFATASLRNINNRDEAVGTIVSETGLTPDILEGHEEAELGYIGASGYIRRENGIMIDIGGASTELVLFKESQAVNLISLPVGCLNLSVDHVSRIIPNSEECVIIKETVKEQLNNIDWGANLNCALMIGVGGTLRAVQKLVGAVSRMPPGQYDIDVCKVKELSKLIKENRDNIYHTIYKTTPERLMTISTGIIILCQVIKHFGCEKIAVSRFGLREGYLIDRVLMRNDRYSIDERGAED